MNSVPPYRWDSQRGFVPNYGIIQQATVLATPGQTYQVCVAPNTIVLQQPPAAVIAIAPAPFIAQPVVVTAAVPVYSWI